MVVYSLANCFLSFIINTFKKSKLIQWNISFSWTLTNKTGFSFQREQFCFVLNEWNNINFLTVICSKSKYLSVTLSCRVDDSITLTLALCKGFGVGFGKARRVCLGGRHQGTSLPRLSPVQDESFWVVSLCFLSPSLPLGAAEPAIVQEEPSARGAYHRAHGTSRRLRD